MAVSKRTRFEVLRRDNYTCRYCRSTEGELTVDHVTPTALGGSDKPDNLVAACKDCNAGKTSTAPDDNLVDDVREDAVRHAELLRQAYLAIVDRLSDQDDYVYEWADAWPAKHLLPADWENTIGRWFEMGVPIEIVRHAAHVASTKSTVSNAGRFTYMCGIVWSQVQMVDELAEAKRFVDGVFAPRAVLDEYLEEGYRQGCRAEWGRVHRDLLRADPLSTVVDRIEYPERRWGVPA